MKGLFFLKSVCCLFGGLLDLLALFFTSDIGSQSQPKGHHWLALRGNFAIYSSQTAGKYNVFGSQIKIHLHEKSQFLVLHIEYLNCHFARYENSKHLPHRKRFHCYYSISAENCQSKKITQMAAKHHFTYFEINQRILVDIIM